MKQRRITDDLDRLMAVLPQHIQSAVAAVNNSDRLLEIVLDLGRIPTARYTNDQEVVLSENEITRADLDTIIERIGQFDADNRAGLERTLHRISAIRNRHGVVVGMTCRVGRAVYGTLDIIQDLIDQGKSILLLGRPGVGKTTMLREAARVLAETQRVVIVDTSNEIGGDGDVPHPAVGKARRMQVSTPAMQHEVMIEAVENHNPQVIVIDEIGRELEAAAARTIAERGVQLIGTAHGNTLENLLLNPTLSDLVGGIESVTLSDEEARRRGTQKTVLERRSPPTFDILIELQTRDKLAVHPDVTAAVDALLRGVVLTPELRFLDEDGEVHIEKAIAPPVQQRATGQTFRRKGVSDAETPTERRIYPSYGERSTVTERGMTRSPASRWPAAEPADRPNAETSGSDERPYAAGGKSVNIYPYGVARNRLAQAAKRLRVPVNIVNEFGEADALVTLRTYFRKRQRTIVDAENRGMPVYVLRSNTVNQMLQFLGDLFNLAVIPYEEQDSDSALEETRSAINAVLNGEDWIELSPASSNVRRLQHQMVRQANLVSHSYGKEPHRRVRIFRQ